MDGGLAQLAALVAHGNAWLAGSRAATAGLGSNSTFQYVRQVRFERSTGGLFARREVAEDPDAWLGQLAHRRIQALWLDTRLRQTGQLPPHLAIAFANGAPSTILEIGPKPERWTASWSVHGTPTPTDSRIWDVAYAGLPERTAVATATAIGPVRASLRAQIEAAQALALRLEWQGWPEHFNAAIAESESPSPTIPYHPDLLPPGASLERRRLMSLAVSAYVFGGMGSWNDMAPPNRADQVEYQRVSARLFAAVLEGIAAAVNPVQE